MEDADGGNQMPALEAAPVAQLIPTYDARWSERVYYDPMPVSFDQPSERWRRVLPYEALPPEMRADEAQLEKYAHPTLTESTGIEKEESDDTAHFAVLVNHPNALMDGIYTRHTANTIVRTLEKVPRNATRMRIHYRPFHDIGSASQFLADCRRHPPEIFYGVLSGRLAGVFTDWRKVARLVEGYKGARVRRFIKRESAEKYVKNGTYGTAASDVDVHPHASSERWLYDVKNRNKESPWDTDPFYVNVTMRFLTEGAAIVELMPAQSHAYRTKVIRYDEKVRSGDIESLVYRAVLRAHEYMNLDPGTRTPLLPHVMVLDNPVYFVAVHANTQGGKRLRKRLNEFRIDVVLPSAKRPVDFDPLPPGWNTLPRYLDAPCPLPGEEGRAVMEEPAEEDPTGGPMFPDAGKLETFNTCRMMLGFSQLMMPKDASLVPLE